MEAESGIKSGKNPKILTRMFTDVLSALRKNSSCHQLLIPAAKNSMLFAVIFDILSRSGAEHALKFMYVNA